MQKFRGVLDRWERRELSQLEAAELLGCSERQFRRYRDRFADEGEAGLGDKRLGKASGKAIPEEEVERMLDLYRRRYEGWNVALPRARGPRPPVHVGVHVDEDAAAHGRAGGSCQAAGRAPSQAREEAVRGHDAASGWVAACLARGAAGARSDRDDGRCDELDLFGVAG